MGPNLIAIFLVFVLIYWVGMARITRSQILVLKESEYVTAARALGASNSRIIRKHLLTNCIGTLIVTTLRNIYRKLFEFPRTRRYGSHAVARFSCHGGRKGYEHLSISAVFTGATDKRYHTCL